MFLGLWDMINIHKKERLALAPTRAAQARVDNPKHHLKKVEEEDEEHTVFTERIANVFTDFFSELQVALLSLRQDLLLVKHRGRRLRNLHYL